MTESESNTRKPLGVLENLAETILGKPLQKRLQDYREERDVLLREMRKEGRLDGRTQGLLDDLRIELMKKHGLYEALKR